MKENIHPTFYPEAQVACACGNTWTVGSTVPLIRTDVCSACHPFFTGEQRIIDAAGQVDRYQKRLKRHDLHRAEEKARAELALRKRENSLLRQQIEALELSERVNKALTNAGIVKIGDVTAKLQEGGDQEILDLEGVGPKALEEIKERLQLIGLIAG